MEKKKRVLVTAGNTITMIDKVRGITNIFKGRTGTNIAEHFVSNNYEVTLVTSNKSLLSEEMTKRIHVITYRTYDELFNIMKEEVSNGGYDIIIHSAAVSDQKVIGVYVMRKGELTPIDTSKKISSKYKELFLRTGPTEKIIDKFRTDWGFRGYIVKFKLQVGLTNNELRVIADKSREDSEANMIVANCLEWSGERAEIRTDDSVIPVSRDNLPKAIREEIEK